VPRFIVRVASTFSPLTPAITAPLVILLVAGAARAEPGMPGPSDGSPAQVAPEGPAVPPQPAPGPAARPIIAPLSAAPASASGGRFVMRAMAGAGFSDYEDRASGDVHMFANGLAAVAAGYTPFQKPQGSLDVALELLLSRSMQGQPGAHAAGDLLAAGLTLSTYLASRTEIGLGGYVVRRATEARDLALTTGRWTAGVGAFLAKYWPVTERWAWGAGVKVLMLPTDSYVDSNGEKHVHFSDGVGILGVSLVSR